MTASRMRSTAELTAHLDELQAAPADAGRLWLVVRRPDRLQREILSEGVLDRDAGLVGDNWFDRATSSAIASGRHLDAQVTVMSHRMVSFLGETEAARAEAGDQLYVDLDLSVDNLPTGSRLMFGAEDGPVIEVTAKPHLGCAKFTRRFGEDAMRFVNSPEGKRLRLRGLNAKVVVGGVVRPGDPVRKLTAER